MNPFHTTGSPPPALDTTDSRRRALLAAAGATAFAAPSIASVGLVPKFAAAATSTRNQESDSTINASGGNNGTWGSNTSSTLTYSNSSTISGVEVSVFGNAGDTTPGPTSASYAIITNDPYGTCVLEAVIVNCGQNESYTLTDPGPVPGSIDASCPGGASASGSLSVVVSC